MPFFKKGDKVETACGNSLTKSYEKAWVGVVKNTDNSDRPYLVEFENGVTTWCHKLHLKPYKEEENVMNQNVENLLTAKKAACAWLDGKEVEFKFGEKWVDLVDTNSLSILKRNDAIFRIKPKKQYKVFGVLFDEDELPQKELVDKTVYFYMDSYCCIDKTVYSNHSPVDRVRLKYKYVFLTEQACKKWYKALAEYDLETCVVEGE